MREMYHDHNVPLADRLELRRMAVYLLGARYNDPHCHEAKVKVCRYCHAIDYVSFVVDELNVVRDGVCLRCRQQKSELEARHARDIVGWDAVGRIVHDGTKFVFEPYGSD